LAGKPQAVVFVIGEWGLKSELSSAGVSWIDESHHGSAEDFELHNNVAAVVFGLDRAISYHKLSIAHAYLTLSPQCEFIGTNGDSTFPGKMCDIPGGGSLMQVLVHSTRRTPLVLGKPSTHMLDAILQHQNMERATTCMIGDCLDTDIKFGNDGGIGTLLVLTGINRVEDVPASDPTLMPQFVASSLALLNAQNESL